VLLAKPPRPCEGFNDINGEVVNLFRIMQHHPEEFITRVRWNVPSRDEYARLKTRDPIIQGLGRHQGGRTVKVWPP
jgi:DNA adenine methylase